MSGSGSAAPPPTARAGRHAHPDCHGEPQRPRHHRSGATSPWLFPGGQPGRPVSTARLTQRLGDLGIRPGQARSTALFQLAAEIPAAILARTLGIHTDVAVTWQRLSAGDWGTYAADVSRRTSATR